MADDGAQRVNTPDGREWVVSIEGRKRSMKETRETPFFWAHVVVTAIIAAVMIWIFRHNSGILWFIVVIISTLASLLGIWKALRVEPNTVLSA